MHGGSDGWPCALTTFVSPILPQLQHVFFKSLQSEDSGGQDSPAKTRRQNSTALTVCVRCMFEELVNKIVNDGRLLIVQQIYNRSADYLSMTIVF